jgi:hypothetical protein
LSRPVHTDITLWPLKIRSRNTSASKGLVNRYADPSPAVADQLEHIQFWDLAAVSTRRRAASIREQTEVLAIALGQPISSSSLFAASGSYCA